MTAAFEDLADARRSRLAASADAPVRLDCEGRASPGLALAWSRDTTGRFWTLELGARARGDMAGTDTTAPRTAAAVAAAWHADSAAASALEWAGVESLVPLDARRLVVGFSSPALELPPLFADRALGLPRPDGRASLDPSAPGGDLRDAVDRGTDLVHTTDPDLLDYARRRPDRKVVPLPWSRSYLLVLPAGGPGIGAAVPADTAGFRAGLARDAVRADARVPEGPFWWEGRDACARRRASAAPRRRVDAIAFDATDRVARDLAERIVALAGTTGLATKGLPPDSLDAALLSGSARAFVLRVPGHASEPCRETADWPPAAVVVPLVETRAFAILRRGTPPLSVEWDGALRPAAP
ncbi:MAG: hypothetical protein ABIY46_09635 [Gemmatimonadales bacterium]